MAWNLLLTSDIGLLSLFTIVFILGMAIYIYAFVKRQMAEEERNPSSSRTRPSH